MKRLLLLAILCASMSSALPQAAQANPEPVLVNQSAPTYPPLAKMARIQGPVKLEFFVNRDGDVASVVVVSGPAMLAPAAVEAIRAWIFRIPKRDSAEDVRLETIVDFVLKEPTSDKAATQAPPVFDSYHHVTIVGAPVVLSDPAADICPQPKEISHPSDACAELFRSACYGKWNNSGTTAFMRAAGLVKTRALKNFLSKGERVFDIDGEGWTALMYAATSGDSEPVGLLLAAHADPNQSSLLGNTPLMVAAARGRLDHDLLKAGADLNGKNAAGTTVLMILAAKAQPEEVSAALKAGAHPDSTDRLHRTALDYLHLANCGNDPIREKPLKQAPHRGPCDELDEDNFKAAKNLLSAALRAARSE